MPLPSVVYRTSTARRITAVKLFEMGRLSSGAAARLAGVDRIIFLSRSTDYGVDIFRLTEEELQGNLPMLA